MKKKFRDTEAWKWIRTLIQLILLVIAIMAIIYSLDWLGSNVRAEELTTGYVICQPDDFVNIRKSPGKKGEVVGMFGAGEEVSLDGKAKAGFLHIVNTGLETDDGWVHKGYIVYDKPEYVNESATIVSKGRLAARKNVNGKRTRWLKPLASLKVYYWSEEWCVTNCGYVQSKYIELAGEQ